MKRIYGTEPVRKEWFAVRAKLPQEARDYLLGVDLHALNPDNMLLTEAGYVFIDYGSSNDGFEHTITDFLTKWKSDLEDKLRIPAKKS